MIRIEYEVGGRKYTDPKQFSDALMAGIMKEVAEDLANQLRSVRCPEHREQPSVRIKAQQSDSIDFEVSGCCDNLVRDAESKLA